MGFKPEDLIAAHPWRKAVFTTYALSLSFFESIVLDGLVRGRAREALVLADPEGIRAALSEQGAQRAGRDYEIEPVAVTGGVFHPKISALVGTDDCHLVVGSGNLTFNGWGGSFEIAEHLHPSFAADAFDDAAEFFMLLSENPKASHDVRGRCLELADDLAGTAAGRPKNGNIRLLHSLGDSIGDSLAVLADGLGGATRLTVMAPFWDAGHAVGRLCRSLGLEAAHIHSHPGGTVRGLEGSNWPASPGFEVVPVTIADQSEGNDRRLHAKAFEIMCRRGRIVMSGSANATTAALLSGNVEACVARIQRERLHGWTLASAEPPAPLPAIEEDASEAETRFGVLRATVGGDIIRGRVLSPAMSGHGRLFRLTSEGYSHLGEVTLDAAGAFELAVPGFEAAAIRGGRLVLRAECGDRAAEGFASLAAVTGLRGFAGKAASSLLAVLAGTETPEDVRVLMEWAHDNPGMLGASFSNGWSGASHGDEAKPSYIGTGDLWNVQAGNGAAQGKEGDDRGWARFVDALLSAMRERRGPVDRDGEAEDESEQEERKNKETKKDPATAPKTLETFELVLDAMLSGEPGRETVLRAFHLSCYVCDRLAPDIHPERAARWLRKLVDAFCLNGPEPNGRETALSAIMSLCGSNPDSAELRFARTRAKRIGAAPDGPCPAEETAWPFRAVMGDLASFAQAWAAVGKIRTWREQVRAYCDALDGRDDGGFDELFKAVPAEAATMAEAIGTEQGRRRILVLDQWQPACRCRMQLPKIELGKLRTYGVARAANCCQKVLVWPENPDG